MYFSGKTCPSTYETLSDGGCYFFSSRRMGWIEAKKKCEMDGGRLLSFETPAKKDVILRELEKTGRSRYEYWLAGNDIDREDRWVWSGTGQPVADFGWIDPPIASPEENCLTWSITISRRTARMSEGWHSDSCCNNIRFICEI